MDASAFRPDGGPLVTRIRRRAAPTRWARGLRLMRSTRHAAVALGMATLALSGCKDKAPFKAERTGSCVDGRTPTGEECLAASTTAKTRDDASLPSGMVEVPAGTFTMGSLRGDESEKPEHEVYVSGFAIDTYEVTVDAYRACVDAGSCETPKGTHDDDEPYNYGASGRGKHPINGVTWHQAVAYCAWKGKRLPTEAEWEKAARGADSRIHPWGNEEPGQTPRLNLMDETAARVFTKRRPIRGYDDGYVTTAPVGSFPAGVSPHGAHDMAGNVWEWTADYFGFDYYASSPTRDPKGPERGRYRVARGGGWNTNDTGTRTYYRSSGKANDSSPVRGFRCARSLD